MKQKYKLYLIIAIVFGLLVVASIAEWHFCAHKNICTTPPSEYPHMPYIPRM